MYPYPQTTYPQTTYRQSYPAAGTEKQPPLLEAKTSPSPISMQRCLTALQWWCWPQFCSEFLVVSWSCLLWTLQQVSVASYMFCRHPVHLQWCRKMFLDRGAEIVKRRKKFFGPIFRYEEWAISMHFVHHEHYYSRWPWRLHVSGSSCLTGTILLTKALRSVKNKVCLPRSVSIHLCSTVLASSF